VIKQENSARIFMFLNNYVQHALIFHRSRPITDNCLLIFLQTVCATATHGFVYSLRSATFLRWGPRGLWPWNSNSAEIFLQCTNPLNFITLV